MSSATSQFYDAVTGHSIGTCGWVVENHPAAAAQPTVTQAAGGDPVRNVCRSLTVSIACAATPQTPIHAYLRDGASGSGTIIWSGVLAAVAGASAAINARGAWRGSPNTAMTLEFEGVTAAGVLGTVAMEGDLAVQ